MRLLPLICVCALIFGCSVKKRNYRHGYYIDWAFHQDKKNGKQDHALKKDHAALPQKGTQIIQPAQEEVLSASGEKILSPKELKKHSLPDLKKSGGCDTLFFRDGKVVTAKVIDILPYEIRYRRCDYLEGPIITINQNDVDKVVFANGVTEKFQIKHRLLGNEFSSPSQNQSKAAEVKNHEAAIIMIGITASIFILGIISAIVGLIYAPIALRRIRESKGKFKGEEIVKICRTICLVCLILFIVVVAFFLFLLTTI